VTDEHAHVIDDLTAYLLGGLDDAQRVRVDAHVIVCATCAQRLDEFRGVIGSIPLALAPVSPPADAWTTIQTAIRQRPAFTRSRLSSARWIGWATAVATIALLLVWNMSLQRDLRHYAEGPQVEKLARRPGRLVILKGNARPDASARLFAAVDGRSGHMAISGLVPLPAGRIYQLWFVSHAGSVAGAATFAVGRDGRAWVVVNVPAPLEETRAILVTEEPAPGSAAPTGTALVEAREWR
jgi:hypothetical protein